MTTRDRMRTQMDRESRANRYYRNAVERHWDPHEIDLEADIENFRSAPILELDFGDEGAGGLEVGFDEFRRSIAKFGAGEDAVTEDLAPFAVVLDDFDDQLFITTQLYEEAKHADFFDRYWHEVIHPIEDELGWQRSDPRDERWFDDAYLELFERNERATERLLTDDTPENRADAFCHYHMTIEGVLAQSGYYGLTRLFGTDEFPVLPRLPGLTEGLASIRSDEGRHVGFGMAKLKGLVERGDVDPDALEARLAELVDLVVTSLSTDDRPMNVGADVVDVPGYARRKHRERLDQIVDATASVPDVETLTAVDDRR